MTIFEHAEEYPEKQMQTAFTWCSALYEELLTLYKCCFGSKSAYYDSPECHVMIAQCYEMLPDKQSKAIQHYERALKMKSARSKTKSAAHHKDAYKIAENGIKELRLNALSPYWIK